MRIVCPSCQAAYEVPEKLLSGASRKVRCARCGDAWTPEPTAAPVLTPTPTPMPEAAMPPPEPEPEPEAKPAPPVRVAPSPPVAVVVPLVVDRLVLEHAEPPPGRGPAMMAAVAWAASVALLGFAGWAGVAWRADIMAAWAPSRRLFTLLGLE